MHNHYASKEALLFAIVDRVHDLADACSPRRCAASATTRLPARGARGRLHRLSHRRQRETRITNRDYIYLPSAAGSVVAGAGASARCSRTSCAKGSATAFTFGELGREDAVEAASMAILGMDELVAEWFDPGGPAQRPGTAALHGRLALRIARGGGGAIDRQR